MERDLRETPAYRDVESFFKRALEPGFGKIADPSDPQPSPDGRSIAFRGERRDALEGHPDGRICLVGSDGSGFRQITNGPHDDDQPRWSPDGPDAHVPVGSCGARTSPALRADFGRGRRGASAPGRGRRRGAARVVARRLPHPGRGRRGRGRAVRRRRLGDDRGRGGPPRMDPGGRVLGTDRRDPPGPLHDRRRVGGRRHGRTARAERMGGGVVRERPHRRDRVGRIRRERVVRGAPGADRGRGRDRSHGAARATCSSAGSRRRPTAGGWPWSRPSAATGSSWRETSCWWTPRAARWSAWTRRTSTWPGSRGATTNASWRSASATSIRSSWTWTRRRERPRSDG